MDAARPSLFAAVRTFAGARAYPLVFGALALLIAVSFIKRENTEWDQYYRVAGAKLAAGEDFYKDVPGFVYPPAAAVMAMPFALVSQDTARWAWFLVNLACAGYVITSAWRMTGGRSWPALRWIAWMEHAILWLGLGGGLLYLNNCLLHTQTDVVIAALLFAGCEALLNGRLHRGGLFFGLAAAFKGPPLLWAAYLVWRGHWSAAFTMVAAFVGASLVPDLVSACPTGAPWLAYWFQTFVATLANANATLGVWLSDLENNQSLSGLVARLFLFQPYWNGEAITALRAVDAAPALVKPLTYLGEMVLLATLFLLMGRPFRCFASQEEATSSPTTRIPPANNKLPFSGQVFEFGIVLSLTLLLSPMSSKAHFGVLVLPCLAVARAAGTLRRPALIVCLWASIALMLLANRSPWGKQMYSYVLWYGAVTWQTLLLTLACTLEIVRQRRAVSLPVTPEEPITYPGRPRTAA